MKLQDVEDAVELDVSMEVVREWFDTPQENFTGKVAEFQTELEHAMDEAQGHCHISDEPTYRYVVIRVHS